MPDNIPIKIIEAMLMSIFTTLLELTLSKIREKNNRPPRQLAGRGRNKQKNQLAGKKFPPLKPLHFFPARRRFLSCGKSNFDFISAFFAVIIWSSNFLHRCLHGCANKIKV